MRKFSLVIAAILFAACNILLAQNIRITGTVTELGTGTVLPFVTIQVKGTTTGTATLDNGSYVINAPANGTLIFSFIGYKTIEVPIQSKSIVNVQLEYDAVTLDEVIMVAYGTAPKESITGSISTVNTKSIEKRPVSSVSGVLEGQAAGVQVNNTYGEPGSDATIRIRGFGSVNGSNAPLYVVDGVPFSGNISDLNPQDIESISVLKDAASSALFGNRASNGVILIATKKGKSGKVQVTASAAQGVYNRGIKEYERLGSREFMEVMWKGYRNDLMDKQPDKYPTAVLAGAEATATLVPTYLKYNIFNAPTTALFDANGKLLSTAQIHSGYDDLNWNDYIERLGYRQDYTITGNAASDKSSYYFSAGYLDEKGYVKSSDFSRFTGRANISVQPKKWFKTGLTLSGSHQISNSTTGDAGSPTTYVNPFYYGRNMAPIYPVFLHDMATGAYILDSDNNKRYDNGSMYGRPQNLDRHIVWETELNRDRTYRNTLASQAFAEIDFMKDFKFTIKGDISLRNSENQTYNNATIGDGAGNKGRASRTFYRYKNYTFQQQLTWKKEFGLHNVDILAGHENYSYNYAYTYGYKTTETFQGGPELINFTEITNLTGYQVDYRTESYLTRARYNFDNKYFAEASFRRDGSSRFFKDNRWGNFWSLGGSWTITKENFMAGLKHSVNSLKLRASYGEVGNDASVDYYGYMALYGMAQNANIGAAYKVQNEALDILWETSSSLGIGIDGTFFDRLNVTLDYFDKRSNDLLFPVNLPLSAGATSTSAAEATITKNLGSVSNRGVELLFDIDVLRKKDFRWNIGFNTTYLKNKIVTLPEQNREKGIISGTKRYVEGGGIYDFWMYQFVGIDQMTGKSLYKPDLEKYYIGDAQEGKEVFPAAWLVQIGDKSYSTNVTYSEKNWSGSAIPDFYGSFNTSLSYKNFDLSMLFTYSVGGKTIDYSYQSLMSVTANPSAIHKDALKAWDGVPAGITESSVNRIDPKGIPISSYSQSAYTNATSSRWLIDASYFVVKNVALSYNLPKRIADKMDLGGLSVNFSVDNLATFTKLQGMNPQQSFAGTNNNAFVTARVFSLGLNIKL